MKKAIKYSLIICAFILVIAIVVYNVNGKEEIDSNESESEVIVTDIANTLTTSSYVSTTLEEKKQLQEGYYFSEIYVEKNQYIAQGEAILKYTNGEYLTSPYNCVVTDISVPNSESMCTNNNYITIQATDTLKINMSVEEGELDTVYEGQEAQIQIQALDNKTYTGYVTKIDNTATYSSSGSTFGVEVEFENDGDILLGMSAKCAVILEKVENVVAVANEAIYENGDTKYVTIKNSDGTTEDINIETGIENDAYTQVISGLNEGDIVIISEDTESTTGNGQFNRGNMGQMMEEFSGMQGVESPPDMQEMTEMPSGGMPSDMPNN